MHAMTTSDRTHIVQCASWEPDLWIRETPGQPPGNPSPHMRVNMKYMTYCKLCKRAPYCQQEVPRSFTFADPANVTGICDFPEMNLHKACFKGVRYDANDGTIFTANARILLCAIADGPRARRLVDQRTSSHKSSISRSPR